MNEQTGWARDARLLSCTRLRRRWIYPRLYASPLRVASVCKGRESIARVYRPTNPLSLSFHFSLPFFFPRRLAFFCYFLSAPPTLTIIISSRCIHAARRRVRRSRSAPRGRWDSREENSIAFHINDTPRSITIALIATTTTTTTTIVKFILLMRILWSRAAPLLNRLPADPSVGFYIFFLFFYCRRRSIINSIGFTFFGDSSSKVNE